MNVYDFDKTIFRVDSTAAFYRHCLRRHPKIARHWPIQLVYALRYLAGRIDKTQMKQCFYRFCRISLSSTGKSPPSGRKIWDGLSPWYLAQRRPDDVIISASPYFLLSPLLEGRLTVGTLMASNVDPSTRPLSRNQLPWPGKGAALSSGLWRRSRWIISIRIH